jgi:hypothetical protein
MRKFLIWLLSKLAKVEVRPNGEIVDIPQEVLFVSPDFTREKFEASENIDEFLTKIHTK